MGADGVKAEILRLKELWIPILRLQNWDISVTFDEKEDLATADSLPRYLRLGLSFNVPRVMSELETRDYFDLEELVVHELCHALTWRMWDLVDQFTNSDKAWKFVTTEIHEEAVTNIGHALVRAHRSLAEPPWPE